MHRLSPDDVDRSCPRCGELCERFHRSGALWMDLMRATPEWEVAVASQDRVSAFYCARCREVGVVAFCGKAQVSDDWFAVDRDWGVSLPEQLVPESLAYDAGHVGRAMRWNRLQLEEQYRKRRLLGRPVVKRDEGVVVLWFKERALVDDAEFLAALEGAVAKSCKGAFVSREDDADAEGGCWLTYALTDRVRLQVQLARLERRWPMGGLYALYYVNEGQRYLARNQQGLNWEGAVD